MSSIASSQLPRRKNLSLVVPFFNEGAGVEAFAAALREVLPSMPGYTVEIICVDDGSTDDTLERLLALSASNPQYKVIELSRNFGKEAALTAGLDAASGAAVVPMDADLQDPPALLAQLLRLWEEGADVVLARRVDRSTDTLAKRKTAQWFYRLHNRVAEVAVPENVGDFRLMDRRVVDALKQLPERQRFMKGLFSWIGFKTAFLDYQRAPRAVGTTKFAGWKLWNFAIEGITSFSTVPLRVWTYMGVGGACLTTCYAAAVLIRTLAWGIAVPGYASLLITMLFLGSLQLISLGLLGEYIGRIYLETKHRPIYVVRNRYWREPLDGGVRPAPRERARWQGPGQSRHPRVRVPAQRTGNPS